MNPPCVEVYEAFEIDYTPFELPDATFRAHFIIKPPTGAGTRAMPTVWRTAERPGDGNAFAWTENYADFNEAARAGLRQAKHAIDQFRQSAPD